MTTRHEAFARVYDDLQAVFSNLEKGGERLMVVWFRQFADVDSDLLEEAAMRAIRDVKERSLVPGAFWPFIEEVRRDRAGQDSPPQENTATCTDSACVRCGGKGTFRADIKLGGEARTFLVICGGRRD